MIPKNLDTNIPKLDNRFGSKRISKRGRMRRLTFEVTLPFAMKRKAQYWVSSCPPLDIFSQGKTEEEAKKNLVTAVNLFLRSCYERGTLDQALKECGFISQGRQSKANKQQDKESFIKVPLFLLADSRCNTECRA